MRDCLRVIASSSTSTCLISLHRCHRRPKNPNPLRLDHGNTLHVCLNRCRSCSPWPSFLTSIPDRLSTPCLYRDATFLRFRPLRQSTYHPGRHPRDYRTEVKMVEERGNAPSDLDGSMSDTFPDHTLQLGISILLSQIADCSNHQS